MDFNGVGGASDGHNFLQATLGTTMLGLFIGEHHTLCKQLLPLRFRTICSIWGRF